MPQNKNRLGAALIAREVHLLSLQILDAIANEFETLIVLDLNDGKAWQKELCRYTWLSEKLEKKAKIKILSLENNPAKAVKIALQFARGQGLSHLALFDEFELAENGLGKALKEKIKQAPEKSVQVCRKFLSYKQGKIRSAQFECLKAKRILCLPTNKEFDINASTAPEPLQWEICLKKQELIELGDVGISDISSLAPDLLFLRILPHLIRLHKEQENSDAFKLSGAYRVLLDAAFDEKFNPEYKESGLLGPVALFIDGKHLEKEKVFRCFKRGLLISEKKTELPDGWGRLPLTPSCFESFLSDKIFKPLLLSQALRASSVCLIDGNQEIPKDFLEKPAELFDRAEFRLVQRKKIWTNRFAFHYLDKASALKNPCFEISSAGFIDLLYPAPCRHQALPRAYTLRLADETAVCLTDAFDLLVTRLAKKQGKKYTYQKAVPKNCHYWSSVKSSVKPPQKLIATLTMKNEERLLLKCLDGMADFVDGIVIIDDGSTDNSIAIARAHKKVLHVEMKKPGSQRQEIRDRNKILSIAKSYDPDWIIAYIDVDEIFAPGSAEKIQHLINNDEGIGEFAFLKPTLWRDDEQVRIDTLKFLPWRHWCLVKNNKELSWCQRVDSLSEKLFGIGKREHQIGALDFQGMTGEKRLIQDVFLLHYSHDSWGLLLEKALRYAFWDFLDLSNTSLSECVARYNEMWDESKLKKQPLNELIAELSE